MKHVELMYAEAERMWPFNEAIETYFRWHVWTDLTDEIKKEVEEAYKKHVSLSHAKR